MEICQYIAQTFTQMNKNDKINTTIVQKWMV